MTTNTDLIELGTLKLNETHTFKFILAAKEHSIRIDGISAGCSSCTTVSTDKNSIIPNSTLDLNVKFTPNSLGFQTKLIHVQFTENSKSLKTTLKFTATVEA